MFFLRGVFTGLSYLLIEKDGILSERSTQISKSQPKSHPKEPTGTPGWRLGGPLFLVASGPEVFIHKRSGETACGQEFIEVASVTAKDSTKINSHMKSLYSY